MPSNFDIPGFHYMNVSGYINVFLPDGEATGTIYSPIGSGNFSSCRGFLYNASVNGEMIDQLFVPDSECAAQVLYHRLGNTFDNTFGPWFSKGEMSNVSYF